MAMPQGYGDKMQVDDAASELSSSSISSPPVSPQNAGFAADTIHVAHPHNSNPEVGGGVIGAAASATPAHTSSLHSTAAHTTGAVNTSTSNGAAAPEKPKRQRKKKEVGADGKPVDDGKPKEKKPRKPRQPKDQTTATGGPRKKIKTEDKAAQDAAPALSRQPTITEMVTTQQSSTAAASNTGPARQTPTPYTHNYADGLVRPMVHPQNFNPPTPRPFSSGQNYDPVRSAMTATVDSNPPRPSQTMVGANSAQASPHVNRASASPSIASLIDPPLAARTSAPNAIHSPQTTMQKPFLPSQPHSPTPPRQQINAFAPPPPKQQMSPSAVTAKPAAISNLDGAMDTDTNVQALRPQQQSHTSKDKMPEMETAPSKSSSSAPTPKAARPTPPPAAPKGTGSGLLSGSNLFGGPSESDTSERQGVNIDIQIKLNPNGGNTINIAQEILKKYGRDAINPRAAAHRERLLQVAAAANKIDGGSGADDMSVDLDSELGDDSNVEMGGMADDPSLHFTQDGKPRKRRKKVEDYDKEDDFIDDTEMAWQESAAVAKDGFFVYSGPLVPPGEAARVESTTASGRGGRGRGRGRGSRGGANAAAGTTHASLAEKKDPAAPGTAPTTGRGRGRGRGSGAPRKPRITKADRERMELEKKERERAASGPSGMPAGTAQPPGNSQTPLSIPTQSAQGLYGNGMQGMGNSATNAI